jgi:uncharacterized protein (TIGR03435 family)
MTPRYALVLTIVTLLAASPSGQQATERLEFEVASIKENREPITGGFIRYVPSGAVNGRHMPARSFITFAYQLKAYQLLEAPDWTRTTFYDLNAKPAGSATREQQLAMLRSLLEDRFNFAAHRETRTMDGFVLQRVRADSLGPRLRASSLLCSPRRDAAGSPIPAPPPLPRCLDGRITANSYRISGFEISQLVSTLENVTSGPVEDETGLTGGFDVELEWSTDAAPIDDVPGIFTALQEQLGLKLERRKVQREVLVVDRMDRPTPD